MEKSGTPVGLTKNADGTYTARENGTYKFIVKDNLNNQKEIKVKISNIDRNVSVGATNIGIEQFTLNITTNYSDEMVEKYIYYVNGKEPIESTSKTQIVDDLTEKTLYTVYVELYSTSGNKVTSKTVEVETLERIWEALQYPMLTLNGWVNAKYVNLLDENDVYYKLDEDIECWGDNALEFTAFDGNPETCFDPAVSGSGLFFIDAGVRLEDVRIFMDADWIPNGRTAIVKCTTQAWSCLNSELVKVSEGCYRPYNGAESVSWINTWELLVKVRELSLKEE